MKKLMICSYATGIIALLAGIGLIAYATAYNHILYIVGGSVVIAFSGVTLAILSKKKN